MKHEVPGLRELLFSMVAPRGGECRHMREPQDAEWDQLLRMARQHRLEPMLHWRASSNVCIAGAPQRFRDAIASSFRQQALRSLELQSHIAAVHRTMSKQGIPAIFLKGAFLAFHVYPHAAPFAAADPTQRPAALACVGIRRHEELPLR